MNLLRLTPVLLLFWVHSFSVAQTVNYNDVAVIINDNSPTSIAVGNYFATKRNLPTANIIHINTDTNETIDSLTFRSMQSQIGNELIASGRLDSLNYLVTTKGMPLRVSIDGTCDSVFGPGITVGKCTSVESELALLFSFWSGEMLNSSPLSNGYFHADQHFSRDSFDIFLVTRLDGYTEAGIKRMIDNSGPDSEYYQPNGKIVLDYAGYDSSISTIFNSRHTLASNFGLTAVNDMDYTTIVASQQSVVGFSGVYGDTLDVSGSHTWEPGSIAHSSHAQGASTFYPRANGPQGVLPDLLEDGATVGISYVYMTFLSPSTHPGDLLDYYLDTLPTRHYNASEAFYMATPVISYHAVMIGDPKTSVKPTTFLSVENPMPEQSLNVFPNPTEDHLNIHFSLLQSGEVVFELLDLRGAVVHSQNVHMPSGQVTHSLSLGSLAEGLYFLKVRAGEKVMVKRVAKL